MKRAAIYSRYSTDRQNELSIADQVRVCTEYAGRTGLRVVATYEDRAKSGAAVGNRPGVQQMQAAALRGEFDVLLLIDVYRLARGADLAKLSERLVFNRVRVVGVQDGADTARDGWEVVFGLAGLIGQEYRRMARQRTRTRLETLAKEGKPTGGRAYGYTADQTVDKAQASIVRQIFKRYVEGAGMTAIAIDLNKRGVPSPGSTWKGRKQNRKAGWMNSGVRVILRNPTYTGEVIWGRVEWRRNPDTGKRQKRLLPESQWIRRYDKSRRIIDQRLWAAVQRRIKSKETAETGKAKRSGGGARFVLSGLLICGNCGSNFIMVDDRCYACSSNKGGGACPVSLRIKRQVIEAKILKPLYEKLLAPTEVKKAVAEMRRYYQQRVRASSGEAENAPAEVKDLDKQIANLRKRQSTDKDMSRAEIQTIIDGKLSRRAELVALQRPIAHKRADSVIAMLPKAAQLYRDEIRAGLSGDDPEAVARARVTLREMLGGNVKLERGPEPGSLYACFKLQRLAVLSRRSSGSGGRI
jgi:site-specific DNA recombinase